MSSKSELFERTAESFIGNQNVLVKILNDGSMSI